MNSPRKFPNVSANHEQGHERSITPTQAADLVARDFGYGATQANAQNLSMLSDRLSDNLTMEPLTVYRLKTVAHKLQVSVPQVYNLIRDKKLPQPITIGGSGRAVGILVTEFDAAVKEWASIRNNKDGRKGLQTAKKKLMDQAASENNSGGQS